MSSSCSSPRRDRLSWWSQLRHKLSQAFFFPIPVKELVESQPVIAWNPGSELQIFSPKAWAMSCTGIKRCRSFMPVRNHNSGQSKLLKRLMLRTRTSVSGDWRTSHLFARAACLACKIILVSASSWFERSVWSSLHCPLATVTVFLPSLKPPPITSSFCGGSWACPSVHSAAERNSHRFTWC